MLEVESLIMSNKCIAYSVRGCRAFGPTGLAALPGAPPNPTDKLFICTSESTLPTTDSIGINTKRPRTE